MLNLCVCWSELGENIASEVTILQKYLATNLLSFYSGISICICPTFYFKKGTNDEIETGKGENQLSNI